MSTNGFIIDGDLSKPTPVSPKHWQRSFADDPNYYVYEQDFQQREPLFRPAINYPPEIPSGIGQKGKVEPIDQTVHRCVEEGPLTPIGGGIVKWTRTYARTPLTRNVWESYNWKMPGLSTGGTTSLLVIDPALSSQGPTVTTIKTTSVHGLSVGDAVAITYNARIEIGFASGSVIQQSQFRYVLSTPTTTTFTVAKILDNIDTVAGVLQWRNVQRGVTRTPILQTVSSKNVIEYFGVGEKGINSPEDIPIIETETILDNTGTQTDTYSTTTTPTAASYRAKLGLWFVAESSIVRNWKGHIYERSTRYVRAK